MDAPGNRRGEAADTGVPLWSYCGGVLIVSCAVACAVPSASQLDGQSPGRQSGERATPRMSDSRPDIEINVGRGENGDIVFDFAWCGEGPPYPPGVNTIVVSKPVGQTVCGVVCVEGPPIAGRWIHGENVGGCEVFRRCDPVEPSVVHQVAMWGNGRGYQRFRVTETGAIEMGEASCTKPRKLPVPAPLPPTPPAKPRTAGDAE
jgi:hypothetical protein